MLTQTFVLDSLECLQVAELIVGRELDQICLELTSRGNFERYTCVGEREGGLECCNRNGYSTLNSAEVQVVTLDFGDQQVCWNLLLLIDCPIAQVAIYRVVEHQWQLVFLLHLDAIRKDLLHHFRNPFLVH